MQVLAQTLLKLTADSSPQAGHSCSGRIAPSLSNSAGVSRRLREHFIWKGELLSSVGHRSTVQTVPVLTQLVSSRATLLT